MVFFENSVLPYAKCNALVQCLLVATTISHHCSNHTIIITTYIKASRSDNLKRVITIVTTTRLLEEFVSFLGQPPLASHLLTTDQRTVFSAHSSSLLYIPCTKNYLSSEGVYIPFDVSQCKVYDTSRDTLAIMVEKIAMEVN